MRRIILLSLIIAILLLSGCCGEMPVNLPSGMMFGRELYAVNAPGQWQYNVTMSAANASSSWAMIVSNALNESARHTTVKTIGNGMDIAYEIWSNLSSYDIDRMHAKGLIGEYMQDRDVSKLQIFTLPDLGLSYHFVPFTSMGNRTVKGVNGELANVTVYSATDNKGFTVTYWKHPLIPVPVFIELKDKNFNMSMMLTGYRFNNAP